VAKDEAKAVELYRRAAADGSRRRSTRWDSPRHRHGDGPKAGRGFSWITKAAESGLAKAQYAVGSMYVEGRGVGRDYARR